MSANEFIPRYAEWEEKFNKQLRDSMEWKDEDPPKKKYSEDEEDLVKNEESEDEEDGD